MIKKNLYVILGARPQFIKFAPLYPLLSNISRIKQIIIHTGQHYDNNMSKVFFDSMGIAEPDFNLNINNVSRGQMIGRMISGIDKIFSNAKPDIVIVFGDTNSTLAGAVASSSYNCEIIHVEAGLRSFNKEMPEEHNRIVADHLSTILCTTSEVSQKNLLIEGFSESKIFLTGDIMLDTFLSQKSTITSLKHHETLNLKEKSYIVATVHRQENTLNEQRLKTIFNALDKISQKIYPVVIPLHPSTKNKLDKLDLDLRNIKFIDPSNYVSFLSLVSDSNFVITDSGGLQKEAYYLGKKSLVLRQESEWTELSEKRESFLINPTNESDIIQCALSLCNSVPKNENLYGSGNSAEKICKIVQDLVD